MAVIFANIPIIDTGNANFTEVDVICGLRIISGTVDRTNRKHGSEPVGSTYSMPWSYPDADLDDLGGPSTIVLTMLALVPNGHSTPLQLSTSVNASTASGTDALEDIDTALNVMVANAALELDMEGLVSRRVRVIPLTEDQTFGSEPIVVELMGRFQGPLPDWIDPAALPDVALGSALAHLDYQADDPRPRTARIVTEPLQDDTDPWLRFLGVSKTGDMGLDELVPSLPPGSSLPAIVMSPWNINTTKPVGDPSDGPISSHAGLSHFEELLTAADLNLDDSDIPTGWILVHDLDYTYRDGFLEIEADLSNTTPLAPEFKLSDFGKLRGEVRLKPARFEDRPFGPGVLDSIVEAEVELEWDDDPGSDLEDFDPVDGWFENIVGGVIRDFVEEEINDQIGDEIEPRILGTLRTLLDDQRPGLFSDDDWFVFREQIVAKFFIRFLHAEFFGTRSINGVNVVGGLELRALGGSYSDNLSVLDLGDLCAGLQVGAAFSGFGGFFALSRFRTVVRADARCSGWHDKYVERRKELTKLATKNRELAASVVRAAFLVSPILASPKLRLSPEAVEATIEVVQTLNRRASDGLRRDLNLFTEVVKSAEGHNLDELITIASRAVPPTAKSESESAESDALHVVKAREAAKKADH